MPNDPDGMKRPSAPTADVAVLIHRLNTAQEQRVRWYAEAQRYRLLADRAQRERDEARTWARRGWDAAGQWKAAFERTHSQLVEVIEQRRGAERQVRELKLYGDGHWRVAEAGASVGMVHDDPGTCEDCGATLQTVRPGKVQCPDCGVCERCGFSTYRGVCRRRGCATQPDAEQHTCGCTGAPCDYGGRPIAQRWPSRPPVDWTPIGQ